MKLPKHSTVVAYMALFFALSGTAYAVTGGTFILGNANTATSTTSLADGSGTPLALKARGGSAPLSVNTNVKVKNLNADLLDGMSASDLQSAKVIEVDEAFLHSSTQTGAYAQCPSGYVAVGGGYTLLSEFGAPDIADLFYSKTDGTDGYLVTMLDANGSPYQGDGEVDVRCVLGTYTPPANQPAMRLRREAAAYSALKG